MGLLDLFTALHVFGSCPIIFDRRKTAGTNQNVVVLQNHWRNNSTTSDFVRKIQSGTHVHLFFSTMDLTEMQARIWQLADSTKHIEVVEPI